MLKNRNIPFGYCVVNGKYALNAPEAEAVQKIFADYINGKSLKTIAAEMQIPYNYGKGKWNINMVVRILENRKYIGEKDYPRIVSDEELERATQIKFERNTIRKPTLQASLPQLENTGYEYKPTDEIQRMTNEINRLIDSENPDKEKVERLIAELAQMKYSTIKEVRT